MAHTTRLPKLRQRLTPYQAEKREKKINRRAKYRIILAGVNDRHSRLRRFFTS